MTSPLSRIVGENTDRVNKYVAGLRTQAADHDTLLLRQAREMAAIVGNGEMRAYLVSRDVTYASATDRVILTAFIGYMQAILAEVARMAERLTPRRAPVQLAMFAPDDAFGTPDMFAHADEFVVVQMDEIPIEPERHDGQGPDSYKTHCADCICPDCQGAREDDTEHYACCEHCDPAAHDTTDDHESPCSEGCTPEPVPADAPIRYACCEHCEGRQDGITDNHDTPCPHGCVPEPITDTPAAGGQQ